MPKSKSKRPSRSAYLHAMASLPKGESENTEISMSQARILHGMRRDQDRQRDECMLSRKVTAFPTIGWAKNPDRSDVPGIDAPGHCENIPGAGTICTLPPKVKFGSQCKKIQRGVRARKKKAAAKKSRKKTTKRK